MYTDTNFKSKKALKDAVKAGRKITYFQPGPFGNPPITDGTIYCEGPHYPDPHTWYAKCTVKDGVIIKVT